MQCIVRIREEQIGALEAYAGDWGWIVPPVGDIRGWVERIGAELAHETGTRWTVAPMEPEKGWPPVGWRVEWAEPKSGRVYWGLDVYWPGKAAEWFVFPHLSEDEVREELEYVIGRGMEMLARQEVPRG